MKQLAEEADTCPTCKDQRITTKIIASIKNNDLRQKLLAITPFPTFQSSGSQPGAKWPPRGTEH